MRRLRSEAMALWPFLVLQCVSMIGIMAEGRLLLIELMMPSPDWTKPPNGKEPIIEPISPPDICEDFPTAIGCPGAPIPMPQEARNSGIRENSWENDDLDLSEYIQSMKMPEYPANTKYAVEDEYDDEQSSEEVEYNEFAPQNLGEELTPPKGEEVKSGIQGIYIRHR